jgi:hypothetical protein
MNDAEIAAALGSARPEGHGWRFRCPLADEHTKGDANPLFRISEIVKSGAVKSIVISGLLRVPVEALDALAAGSTGSAADEDAR